MNNSKKQSGVALLVSILFVGILLSIVFALTAIFLPKIRSAGDIRNSVSAAYAAESALEWCLYINQKGDITPPVMGNGSSYLAITTDDCKVSPVKSVGTYRGVKRAFELSF